MKKLTQGSQKEVQIQDWPIGSIRVEFTRSFNYFQCCTLRCLLFLIIKLCGPLFCDQNRGQWNVSAIQVMSAIDMSVIQIVITFF